MRFALTVSSLRGRLIRRKNAAPGGLLLCFGFAPHLWFASSTKYCAAQSPLPGAQASPMGGSTTGAPHAAVFAAEHRPTTAGRFTSVGSLLAERRSGALPCSAGRPDHRPHR